MSRSSSFEDISAVDRLESKRRHQEIEKQLKADGEKFKALIKVLLLGGGDSGKSTVLKQMRLIHDTAFTEEEIESFRQIIFSNLTHGMQLVLESMPVHSLQLASRNLPYANLVQNTLDVREGQPFPCNHLGPLKSLWADPAVQEAILRGNESALPDNLTYLYTHIDRFFDAAYKPTDVDITYCRVRTTGIAETMLTMKGKQLLMVDVGGQKSERRKWIHCFQDVTAILFLASLSGYDQCLTEDWDVNQMKDAMTIWKSICASSWFKNTAIILFLNKNDIFEEKIQRSHVKAFFPYTGPVKDAPAARQFFRREFMHIAGRTGRRQIYTHITTATDTNMLRSVMASVQDVFVNRNLEKTCMI